MPWSESGAALLSHQWFTVVMIWVKCFQVKGVAVAFVSGRGDKSNIIYSTLVKENMIYTQHKTSRDSMYLRVSIRRESGNTLVTTAGMCMIRH